MSAQWKRIQPDGLLTDDERRQIKYNAHRAINTPDLEWARDMVMFLAYAIFEYDAALTAALAAGVPDRKAEKA